ncbi:hypothetical protein ABZ408_01390 [Streptomyces tibetensis]|uniref:hypothetical protein n=1 Tax=Streptomyces tibetensis TaxID=2382123 RepID=UPI0033F0A7A5
MHIYIDGPDKPCTVRTRVRVPLRLSTGLMVDSWVSTFHGLRDGAEHLAVELGPADTRTPLVRVHSECLTGDVFGSARCDCGPQLDEALVSLHAAGGVLVHLRLVSTLFNTTANTTVQLSAQTDMRGRVMGLYTLVYSGGTTAAMAACAAVALTGTLTVAWARRRSSASAT